jgi:hypothetical protein
MATAGSDPADDPYRSYKQAVTASFATAMSGPVARLGSTADDIAKVITRAATVRRPRTRYLINPVAKGLVGLKRWLPDRAYDALPDRAYDALLRRQYGLPRAR